MDDRMDGDKSTAVFNNELAALLHNRTFSLLKSHSLAAIVFNTGTISAVTQQAAAGVAPHSYFKSY